ncbi:unnamed protein product, partial [Nesidiocoris tenuis]
MRELANNRVSEEILKTLWLQRLPANVQGILSVSADPNLATLAILADKILEVCDPRNSVCVVNNELPISNRSRSPNADIADRIEALTRRFDEFESRYSSRLPRPRDRSRTRSKSPRRLSRSARQKVDNGSWLCRYHFRFVPWSLMVDASDTAIGGSVQQLVNGSWQPLGFYSRKLSENERKYSAYDRELLTAYACVKQFRYLLEGRIFTLYTDHKPLTYAFRQKSDKSSPRQARQLDYIGQFTTDIQHISGKDNVVADYLSRIESITTPLDYTKLAAEQREEDLPSSLSGSSLTWKRILVADSNVP